MRAKLYDPDFDVRYPKPEESFTVRMKVIEREETMWNEEDEKRVDGKCLYIGVSTEGATEEDQQRVVDDYINTLSKPPQAAVAVMGMAERDTWKQYDLQFGVYFDADYSHEIIEELSEWVEPY